MGGEINVDLTEEVTHLLVAKVGSQKYKVGRTAKVPDSPRVTNISLIATYTLHITGVIYSRYSGPESFLAGQAPRSMV